MDSPPILSVVVCIHNIIYNVVYCDALHTSALSTSSYNVALYIT